MFWMEWDAIIEICVWIWESLQENSLSLSWTMNFWSIQTNKWYKTLKRQLRKQRLLWQRCLRVKKTMWVNNFTYLKTITKDQCCTKRTLLHVIFMITLHKKANQNKRMTWFLMFWYRTEREENQKYCTVLL